MFGRVLFPLVSDALARKQPFDEAFAANAGRLCSAFSKTFNWGGYRL